MAEEINGFLDNDEGFNQECEKIFTQFDADGSGFLDKTEMKACLADLAKDIGIPEPSDQDVDEAMKDLDTNQDGKVSQDEFKVLVKLVFAAIVAGLAEAFAEAGAE
uniref:EF-hand domain-containing protein n=1 Tax=Euplotes harpa TaxID=151035 RepID=A0A7S3JA71_9SPIT|mmetsp:Transcript_23724/g.27287  ORF Transcript_23724/g.27287 Transcript_23724/m.27287 type:complete len:106 (+) Transcript_23724:25-342(+)